MKEQIIEMLYKKYGRMMLTLREASKEWGSSYSQTSKQLSLHSKKYIIEHNIMPNWKTIGGKRMWSIESIANWVNDE